MIGIVDLNVIIEICDVDGNVIVIGIVDGIGFFVVNFLVGMVNVNEILIVLVKDFVGNISILIIF